MTAASQWGRRGGGALGLDVRWSLGPGWSQGPWVPGVPPAGSGGSARGACAWRRMERGLRVCSAAHWPCGCGTRRPSAPGTGGTELLTPESGQELGGETPSLDVQQQSPRGSDGLGMYLSPASRAASRTERAEPHTLVSSGGRWRRQVPADQPRGLGSSSCLTHPGSS